ncbi:MAG: PAS domain-containing protein [Candidatus Eremiobacteraeota bacterium]|nr:PAS domain-containing protein [Candidatus Eremiobacteraeota bacterium]MBC5801962.1 PAS domain-containing protein [Candidatus Eremiobacteraeota bacterium]
MFGFGIGAAGIVLGFAIGRLPLRAAAPSVSAPPASGDAAGTDSRFEQLLQSLTVGVIMLDRNGRIESLNAAAGAILELTSGRVLGRAIIEVVPSFELDRRVHEALAGNPSRGRVALARSSGTRMLTVATLPLDGSDGVLVIAADETRLHELEQTRRDFISSVSHELRTPLSSINLMIETILDTSGDPEAIELFLPRIKHEVDRMVQLVEDLLELTRAEAGRLRLRRESVDLASVAGNILRTFEPSAAQLGVHLRMSENPARIDGDPDRLAQVLVNLIDNSLRHTPAGGTVTVEVRTGERGATLAVHDTGAGIPFNDLPHVFERFYVVDRSRAREASGTGLGLSIVKGIVEAHGGTVSAESELGRGATFTCAFPASRAAPASR